MNLEAVKSYALVILVGISFMLTFSLWSYQSTNKLVEEGGYVNQEDMDLDGTVETKKSLIQPYMLIFDDYNHYYGFEDPTERQALYKDMQEWVLYNMRINEANGKPDDDKKIEMIFPDALPMKIIPSLFTINNTEEVRLPENVLFERVYITFTSNNSLTFTFLSTDGQTQVQFDVNNTQKRGLLQSYMNGEEELIEYEVIEESEHAIYVPSDSITFMKYSSNYTEIDPNKMRNALFQEPSRAIINQSEENELWFQDSQRTMQVYSNKIGMEFVNPLEYLGNQIDILDLLDKSITRTNSYKGWTQEFHLENLDSSLSSFRYRMFYKGYPVFSNDNLAMIEELWVNNELSELKRPLFNITNIREDVEVELPSGSEIISYLEDYSSYELSEIQAIQVGYRLSYQETPIKKLSFTPTWYMKVNDNWEPISIDDEILFSKGVS
jgi:regulatory protein YycH of two-component signal transduction system YycFG